MLGGGYFFLTHAVYLEGGVTCHQIRERLCGQAALAVRRDPAGRSNQRHLFVLVALDLREVHLVQGYQIVQADLGIQEVQYRLHENTTTTRCYI